MDDDRHPGQVEDLGRFLRSRRALVSPAAAGLTASGRRRVPGLRRDEVAALAGVSPGYYTRLEQGRELSPSRRVLDAVAKALRLDEADTDHLYRLVKPAARRTRAPARVERVSDHLRELIESWTRTPALLIGNAQDILAMNALAAALYSDFAEHDNVLRMLFLDHATHSFYRNAERAKDRAVSDLQRAAARDPDDPRILELVGELSVRSSEFRSMWARVYINVAAYEVKQLHHSGVGNLELRHEALNVRSKPGQQLIVLQAEPGSPSEDALALLSSLPGLSSPS
ncbi:helix-turn-helix transcriptional regulator [Streptomyces sp. PSRA5]|uniref:helix-turn-helix transcriptional regulator n=1 Tax=Streptomyces panacea TaxID=3035064 RepID=UPI00339CBA62